MGTFTPTVAYSRPTTCGWCGASLARVSPLFEGKDGKPYCREVCMTRGNDRHLRYTAALAGTVSSHWMVVLAALLSVVMLSFAFTPKARAQEHHHRNHVDFYQHWKQPTKEKSSCCNARFDANGNEVGDCEIAIFDLKRDQQGNVEWWAFVPKAGRSIPIPWEKIIREINPDPTGRDGHVCYTPASGVLCAVPPTGAL